MLRLLSRAVFVFFSTYLLSSLDSSSEGGSLQATPKYAKLCRVYFAVQFIGSDHGDVTSRGFAAAVVQRLNYASIT